MRRLQEGVLLKDADQPVLADEVEQRDEFSIALTISEGRYHQVKRMLEYLTLKLRHAVSTGEYITVEMLESALDDYRKSVKE